MVTLINTKGESIELVVNDMHSAIGILVEDGWRLHTDFQTSTIRLLWHPTKYNLSQEYRNEKQYEEHQKVRACCCQACQ